MSEDDLTQILTEARSAPITQTRGGTCSICEDSQIAHWRPPTPTEMRLLDYLLGHNFRGAASLRQQLQAVVVRPLDEDGSLDLWPASPHEPLVLRRVPVEATYADIDGVPIHVLVHVVAGFLDELEVFREDSRPVQMRPTADLELEFEPWIE